MTASGHSLLGYLQAMVAPSRGEQEDDRELLHRFTQARDGDTFALLMRRHGPMVLGLALRVLRDEQSAEDVFQAAFLMLARKASTIRRAESLSCWLHGVAFRLALRARRSRQFRQEREIHVQRPSPPTPLDKLTAREILTVLDEELGNVPEKCRAPLILCCLEGLSQEEAAKRLGCSAGAVRGRLERGRKHLRRRLEQRGLTLPAVLGGALLLAGSTSPVPAALAQATMRAATMAASPPPLVAALMEDAMRSTLVAKVKILGAVVTLLVLTGVGTGMMALRSQADEKNPPAAVQPADQATSTKERVDRHGDPLPEGAVLRLGTLQRRAVAAKLAVTRDGKSIVTVRAGLYVHVWDAATGRLRHKRQLPRDVATDSALSPDGHWLLTGVAAGEGRLTLWDLQTGKRVRTLAIDGATNVGPAAFSADGKAIAAAASTGKGHCIRVWESTTGKEIFAKEIRQSKGISRLFFSPDGKRLLTHLNGESPTLVCWDVARGRPLWDVAYSSAYAMVCTPDGKLLPSDRMPALDLATGEVVSSEKMPTTDGESVLRQALSPDGRTLFVSTWKKVIVWDRVQSKVVRTLPAGGEQIVVWPDGKSLLTNLAGLQRWDVDSGKPLYADTFAWGHVGEVRRLAWSADGRRVASGAEDGTLRLWDASTGRALHLQRDQKRMRLVDNNHGMETGDEIVDLSPDGRLLLTHALGEDALKVWEADTGKEIRSLIFPARERREGSRQLVRARITADGSRVVALLGSQGFVFVQGDNSPTHKVVVWDVKTGRQLSCHPIGWLQSPGTDIAPDGSTVLSDGILIDAATGKETARLEAKGLYVAQQPVVFSRDSALVAGAFPCIVRESERVLETSPDGVRIWETATGKMIAHVNTKSWSRQLAFHPNNRFVATNERDGIQLWDVRTGKLAAHRQMPEKVPVYPAVFDNVFADCFAFSAEGRLATGHPDSTILVWDVPLPASKPQRLQAKELETLWTDLAGTDAAKAWRAVWRLADAPQDVLPFLRGRVKPAATAPGDVTRKLLSALDSDSFEVREASATRLKELGLQAEPALRAALTAKPSLEQRRRIEDLLASLQRTPSPPTAEELRQLRALIVLERIGSPEARRLLEEAARGPQSARLTRQAQAALACTR